MRDNKILIERYSWLFNLKKNKIMKKVLVQIANDQHFVQKT